MIRLLSRVHRRYLRQCSFTIYCIIYLNFEIKKKERRKEEGKKKEGKKEGKEEGKKEIKTPQTYPRSGTGSRSLYIVLKTSWSRTLAAGSSEPPNSLHTVMGR